MPDLLVRGLDPDVYERLREQAARNGRSIAAEARDLIARGVRMSMDEFLERSDRWVAETAGRELPDILELIREDRDR